MAVAHPDQSGAVGEVVDFTGNRDDGAVLPCQHAGGVDGVLGGIDALRTPPTAAPTGQSKNLRGVAADERRGGVCEQARGDLGAPDEPAHPDRVEYPRGAGRRGGADRAVHRGHRRLLRRAEVDQDRIGDSGERPGFLRVVDHRRARANREQDVRRPLGHDDVGQALHQRGVPAHRGQSLGHRGSIEWDDRDGRRCRHRRRSLR